MKIRTFGRATFDDALSFLTPNARVVCTSIGMSASPTSGTWLKAAIEDYMENRGNGNEDDNPPRICEHKREFKWEKNSGGYEHNKVARYDEGPDDKVWMKERDRNYLARLYLLGVSTTQEGQDLAENNKRAQEAAEEIILLSKEQLSNAFKNNPQVLERYQKTSTLYLTKQITANSIAKVDLKAFKIPSNPSCHDEEKLRPIVASDLGMFLERLKFNQSVTELNLAENSAIKDEIIEPLIRIFKPGFFSSRSGPNTTLTSIDLRGTGVTSKGVESLKAVIKDKKLSCLVLNDFDEQIQKQQEKKVRQEQERLAKEKIDKELKEEHERELNKRAESLKREIEEEKVKKGISGNTLRLKMEIIDYGIRKYESKTLPRAEVMGWVDLWVLAAQDEYKKMRLNGDEKMDMPAWPFPHDGKIGRCTSLDIGENSTYETQYIEGTGDKKWMMECDRNYLARLYLIGANTLQEKHDLAENIKQAEKAAEEIAKLPIKQLSPALKKYIEDLKEKPEREKREQEPKKELEEKERKEQEVKEKADKELKAKQEKEQKERDERLKREQEEKARQEAAKIKSEAKKSESSVTLVQQPVESKSSSKEVKEDILPTTNLAKVLEDVRNNRCTEVKLSHAKIQSDNSSAAHDLTGDDLKPLITALGSNTSVVKLDLSHNKNIDDKFLAELEYVISPGVIYWGNETLREVDLRGTNITVTGLQKFLATAKKRKTPGISVLKDLLLPEEMSREILEQKLQQEQHLKAVDQDRLQQEQRLKVVEQDRLQQEQRLKALESVVVEVKSELSEAHVAMLKDMQALYPKLQSVSLISQQTLSELQGQAIAFTGSMSKEKQAQLAEQERAYLLHNASLGDYYYSFIAQFTSTYIACKSIHSGKVKDQGKMALDYCAQGLEYVSQGIDALVKPIPILSALTAAFAGIVKAYTDHEKQMAANKVADFFTNMQEADVFIELLARRITFVVATEINQLAAKKVGVFDKVIQKATAVIDWLAANDVDTVIKKFAEEHFKKILQAIIAGTLQPHPTPADLAAIIKIAVPSYQPQNPSVSASTSQQTATTAAVVTVATTPQIAPNFSSSSTSSSQSVVSTAQNAAVISKDEMAELLKKMQEQQTALQEERAARLALENKLEKERAARLVLESQLKLAEQATKKATENAERASEESKQARQEAKAANQTAQSVESKVSGSGHAIGEALQQLHAEASGRAGSVVSVDELNRRVVQLEFWRGDVGPTIATIPQAITTTPSTKTGNPAARSQLLDLPTLNHSGRS